MHRPGPHAFNSIAMSVRNVDFCVFLQYSTSRRGTHKDALNWHNLIPFPQCIHTVLTTVFPSRQVLKKSIGLGIRFRALKQSLMSEVSFQGQRILLYLGFQTLLQECTDVVYKANMDSKVWLSV